MNKEQSFPITSLSTEVEISPFKLKVLKLIFKFIRSKKNEVIKLKPGEARVILTENNMIIFVRRLENGRLRYAMSKGNKLISIGEI